MLRAGRPGVVERRALEGPFLSAPRSGVEVVCNRPRPALASYSGGARGAVTRSHQASIPSLGRMAQACVPAMVAMRWTAPSDPCPHWSCPTGSTGVRSLPPLASAHSPRCFRTASRRGLHSPSGPRQAVRRQQRFCA
ncbi:hypothetical protein NDU88_005913 [Pleurodeles waltl]|uniref:Uncharacterized protein n=1 Tax=Pleurodeles waltl TaxID=8319 RepID=A0AAV7QMF0_PLEWA|nr:hypothetical protein NDU88_005913 [Pleurodeles waltl]